MRRAIKPGLAAIAAITLAAFTLYTQPKAAPPVQYVSIFGQQTSQAALHGQVVLVNFWATTCNVCRAEMPKLVATHDKYRKQGLATIAVAMSYDPPNAIAGYTQANHLPFFVALDVDGGIARQFGDVALTPTTFLIDKRGNIVQRFTGEPDFAVLQKLIEQKLAEAV